TRASSARRSARAGSERLAPFAEEQDERKGHDEERSGHPERVGERHDRRLPSAGIGALLALMLFHTELSVIALIGIILLIGIVKKNAILMIDFALEAERDQGLSTREA